MNSTIIIVFLSILAGFLLLIVVYQQLGQQAGMRRSLREISGKLQEIMETDSDERIYVFTEEKELQELAAQLNSLLERHLKVKADYRRSEIASKKMLSNISHDIKTPMTVILGYLEILRLKSGTPDEMILKAECKAKEVMELINEFFTLAKLESGDMAPELTPIDVCEQCRKSILDYYELLTGREFQVEVDLPKEPVLVQGNQESISRILNNLISNAIRYGSDGRYLGLALRAEEKAAYVDVTDRGKGIEASFADSVFERLFTMEDSRNREIQGNGLGLTIARDLARQMGGEITLKSEPHVKTVFTVRLARCSK
ncbi:MAG: sensor histidine kinase [Lachnospiraceae bacterium]|nr:sensor histidine kinase [Lachnospiraceae bacterium]